MKLDPPKLPEDNLKPLPCPEPALKSMKEVVKKKVQASKKKPPMVIL